MPRIGEVQSYVLLLLHRGINSFRSIVETLGRYSIPKSSVYTAIEELVEKGAVTKRGDVLELTEQGSQLLATAARTLVKRLSELSLTLTLIGESLALNREALSHLDPDALVELRERLRELLEAIDDVLKSWRSVEIEWG